MPMIGMSFFGSEYFSSVTGSVRNIKRVDLANSLVDELEIRERTDIPMTNVRNTWQPDTLLLARFINTLEAGNLQNEGIKVQSFVIKRRKIGELNDIVLDYEPFENNQTFVYTDITQPNDKFIYTISPVGENGIEGQPNSIEIESDFTGYFLVDAETDQVFAFDKAIGNLENVDKVQNKGRVQINTFSPFPRFIYTNQNYSTFTLSTVLIPNVNERSHKQFERLQSLINENKPLLVKGSNGSMYVCEASNLRDNSPKNTWTGHDYMNVSLDFTEIMTVKDYMSDNLKEV